MGVCDLSVVGRRGACDMDELERDIRVHACEGDSLRTENGQARIANREMVGECDFGEENSGCSSISVGRVFDWGGPG